MWSDPRSVEARFFFKVSPVEGYAGIASGRWIYDHDMFRVIFHAVHEIEPAVGIVEIHYSAGKLIVLYGSWAL